MIETLASIFATFTLIAYWVFAFAILYHLTRFGIGVFPKRLSAVFLLGSITLFAAAVLSYSQISFPALP